LAGRTIFDMASSLARENGLPASGASRHIGLIFALVTMGF